jgi:prephenate dehydrogenase
MAGTAHSGWDAGDPDLFRGATWLIAADDDADPDTWGRVARLALDSGARVVSATSADHDAAVARISHLGHVLAEALALAGGRGGDLALSLAAGSFRDGTRVAGTAPDLVRAICEPNRDALLDVLDECLADLGAARASLAERGTLGPLVDDGHRARRAYEDAQADRTGGDLRPAEVTPGAAGWLEALREAGAAGRAVRLADRL